MHQSKINKYLVYSFILFSLGLIISIIQAGRTVNYDTSHWIIIAPILLPGAAIYFAGRVALSAAKYKRFFGIAGLLANLLLILIIFIAFSFSYWQF